MKIIILDQGDFLGGAELANITIANHLANDHKVTLLHNGSQKYSDQLSPKIHQKIIKLPQLTFKNTLQAIKAVWQLLRYVRQHSYDIIHTNTTRGALYTFLAKPKLLKWTHYAHDCCFPRKAILVLKKCHHIFTCSDLVAKDLQNKGITSHKLQTIYNGFEIKKWQEVRKKKNNQKKVIALVGRMDTWKGHDIFVQIAQQLPQYQFWIIGQSSVHDQRTTRFEQKLRQHCQHYNITNVIWKGWMKQEKIWSQINLLLHLSTKAEPMGRTIIEALLTHTPLIASTYGGAGEILNTPSLSQFLITPEDQSRIIKKIDDIFSDQFHDDVFQASCDQRTQDFDVKKVAQKILTVWS